MRVIDALSLLRDKRDGKPLSRKQLYWLVDAVISGAAEEAQLGAFLMAVYQRGMSAEEQAHLTLAMRDSGTVLRWRDVPGPVLDKHSTGGVGDLVSLVLAPLVAACGGYMPMISGRGLGHTGGTLDKLESIPGFSTQQSESAMDDMLRRNGLFIVGQSATLAPADQRLYALRDITGTVSCQPLIVSSILSKKLAEGLQGLVLDIKTGNGAILRQHAEAEALGQALCNVAVAAGLPCSALITDMNQPLGSSAGNALEVAMAVDFLRGHEVPERLHEVVFALGEELLQTGRLAADAAGARDQLEAALASGAAAERFARMVAAQGGPGDFMDRPEAYLPAAPVQCVLRASEDGVVSRIDTQQLGEAVRGLGAGRRQARDRIDPAVGISACVQLGSSVTRGDPLLTLHAASEAQAREGLKKLAPAFMIGAQSSPPRLIYQRLQAQTAAQEASFR